MRWQERQDQIEQAVYDALDELSDELSIDLPYYPEVWWLGNTVKFKHLGLPKYLKEEFKERNKYGISYCFGSRRIVIIGKKVRKHSILEESSHMFHFLCSNITSKNRSINDWKCMCVLMEMIGFLGARILGSDLVNPYEDFPDLSLVHPKAMPAVKQVILKKLGQDVDFDEFFFHQQGYGLGDRIYFKYFAGDVPISKIRRLFFSRFARKDGAINTFVA